MLGSDERASVTVQADVAVIGMGPGGEEVSGSLAEGGLEVVGIERLLLGGECPYWGCVPSKMMIRAANSIAEGRRVPKLAGRSSVDPDWSPVAQRLRFVATDNWNDRVAVERFEGKGGRFIRGEGRLLGPGRVGVGEEVIEARRGVVIATGAAAVIPPIPGLDEVDHWTNRGFVEAETLPASMVLLGGGAVGVELAQVAARFGTHVTVVDTADRLIPFEEPEAGRLLTRLLAEEGMELRLGRKARSVARDGAGVAVTLDDGAVAAGDRLLVATGRRPDLRQLGLETVGLDPGAPALEIDGSCRVKGAEVLWAVGDCTGHGAFTHVAIHQARIAAADILGRPHAPAEYHALPRVTFTDPEVGAVGLTAEQAVQRGLRVRTGSAELPASARGWIHGPGNDGFIKLVEDEAAGVLVGATSVGPWGGEVLSLLSLAVHARVPTRTLRDMIYAYPTFHRAVEDALRDLAG
jgi:pyruvate/2-oxoglutarate dehydrogenase complex dihydrolipoamide dehydrogenase (E3) component